MPQYPSGPLNGVSTNECPVSLITPESSAWVDLYVRSRILASMGIGLYGPNLSQWPIAAVDAFTLLELERTRADRLLSH